MCRPTIVSFLFALFVPAAALAQDDPRLLRIIWDVGHDSLYCLDNGKGGCKFDETLTSQTSDWKFPPRSGEGEYEGYREIKSAEERFVQKGDHIRVYVVGYNPIAHASAGTTITEIGETPPDLVLAFTALMGRASGGAFTASDRWRTFKSDALVPPCSTFGSIADHECGKLVRTRLKSLTTLATEFDSYSGLTRLLDQALPVFARDEAAVVGSFDEAAVSRELEAVLERHRYDEVRGTAEGLVEEAQFIASLLAEARRVLVDREIAGANVGDELASLKRLELDFKTKIDALAEAATVWERVDRTATRYRAMLGGDAYGDYAIFVTTVATAAPGVIVFDQSFKPATDPKSLVRWDKSTSVIVRHVVPWLMASVGMGFLPTGFEFHENKLRALPTEPLTYTIVQEPTHSFRNLEALTLAHLRHPDWHVPVFASVGTTFGNQSFFKNLVLGASYYHAPWRMVVTAGAIGARGASEEDLAAVAALYLDEDGLVGGPQANPVFLPGAEDWHWRFILGVGFWPF